MAHLIYKEASKESSSCEEVRASEETLKPYNVTLKQTRLKELVEDSPLVKALVRHVSENYPNSSSYELVGEYLKYYSK